MTDAPAASDVSSLNGVRLYSPLAIAVYSVAFNLPFAAVLVGLNWRARGDRVLGGLLIALSLVAGVGLIAAAFVVGRVRWQFAFGLVGAFVTYGLESRPFAAAVSRGATRAQWWPPALVILVLGGLAVLAELLWLR
jgi:hypothetical protein